MSEIDESTDKVLKNLENICGQRFSGYAIVCVDGEKVYSFYSSAIMAAGAGSYLKYLSKDAWDRDDEDGE